MYGIFFLQSSERPEFPQWWNRCVNLSHLMITVSCSSNCYIYFIKYSRRQGDRDRRGRLVSKFRIFANSLPLGGGGATADSYLTANSLPLLTNNSLSVSPAVTSFTKISTSPSPSRRING